VAAEEGEKAQETGRKKAEGVAMIRWSVPLRISDGEDGEDGEIIVPARIGFAGGSGGIEN
jgi:hypothetical protein